MTEGPEVPTTGETAGDEELARLEQAVETARASSEAGAVATAMHAVGRHHGEAGQHAEAARWLERAKDAAANLPVDERVPLLLDLGGAKRGLGRLVEARKLFQQAATLAAEAGATGLEATACEAWGALLHDDRRWNEAEEVFDRAAAVAETAGDGALGARVAKHLAALRQRRRDHDGARQASERYVAFLEAGEDRSELLAALERLAESSLRARVFPQAEDAAQRAIALAGELADRRAEERAICILGRLADDRGDHARAADEFARAAEVAAADGRPIDEAHCVAMRAEARRAAGDADACIADFKIACERVESTGDQKALVQMRARFADALRSLGRLQHAIGVYDLAIAAAEAAGQAGLVLRALEGKSRLLISAGEHHLAHVSLDRRLAQCAVADDDWAHARCLADMARVLGAEGRFDQAVDRSAEALEIARRVGRDGLLGDVGRVHGESLIAAGRVGDGVNQLRNASQRALRVGHTRDAIEALEAVQRASKGRRQAGKFGQTVERVVDDLFRDGGRIRPEVRLDAARVLTHFGRLGAARRQLERARSMADGPSRARLRAAVEQAFGQLHRLAGEPQAAAERFEARVGIERERGNARELAFALNSLGAAFVDLAAHDRALEAFTEAKTTLEEAGDRFGVAMVENGAAMALHGLGRSDEALASLEHALELHRAIGGDEADTSVTLNTRGEILRELGRHDDARRDLERCLALADAHDDERGLGFVLPRLGLVKLASGDVAGALADLERGVDVVRRNPDRRQAVRARVAFVEALVAAERADDAVAEAKRAHDLAGRTTDPSLVAATSGWLEKLGVDLSAPADAADEAGSETDADGAEAAGGDAAGS